MTGLKTLETVTCCRCGESEEYWDDHKTFDCMPDGMLLDNGREWTCSDCMTPQEQEA